MLQPSAIAATSDKENQEQQGKLQQVDEGEEGNDVVHMWKKKRKGWGNRARVVSGAAEDFAANSGMYWRGMQPEARSHSQLDARSNNQGKKCHFRRYLKCPLIARCVQTSIITLS